MFGSLLEELATTLPADADSSVARAIVASGLRRYLSSKAVQGGDSVDVVIDTLIANLDLRLSLQLDAIFHHPNFQALESAWRGLKLVVDRTDFRQNIKCEFLNCSKDDLLADFEDAPEVPKSGFYKLTYSAEYGPFGGRPYAVVFANYTFGPGPQDVMLLAQCATVGWMTAAPFIAAAGPTFLGRRTLQEVASLPLVEMGPQKSAWNRFRATEAARFTALLLGRFLLRAPWALDGRHGLVYQESVVGSSDYLWAHAGYALAVCIARSFATRRVGSHMVGPISGLVPGLPSCSGADGSGPALAVEASITEARAREIVADGLIPLQPARDESGVVFLHDPTAALASDDAEQQLSSVLFAGRVIHYIKVLQREQIGTWKERDVLEAELREFFTPYVFADPAPADLGRTPRSLVDPLETQLFLALTTHQTHAEHAGVYADWLEERGHRAESDFLRSQTRYIATPAGHPNHLAALGALRQASLGLDPGWHAAVSCVPEAIPTTQQLFRAVQLDVMDAPESVGWYRISVQMTLNCTVGGKPVTLSITNKLDRE